MSSNPSRALGCRDYIAPLAVGPPVYAIAVVLLYRLQAAMSAGPPPSYYEPPAWVVFSLMGAGVMSSLAMGSVSPHTRWTAGVALLVAMELGTATAVALLCAMGGGSPHPAWFAASLVGTAAGIGALSVCSPALPRRTRLAAAGVACGGCIIIPTVCALLASNLW